MKKIVIVLIALLLLGCAKTKETGSEEPVLAQQEIPAPKIPTIITNLPAADIEDSFWIDSCRKDCGEEINCIDSCLSNNAIYQQDEIICFKITSPVLKQSCRNNVLLRKATITKNIVYCQNITDPNIAQICNNKLSG